MEATRIARANKRTITDMEHLGKELKVVTSQEIGMLTKGLLEATGKQEKELTQLASEAKKYELESKVSECIFFPRLLPRMSNRMYSA